MTIVDIQASDIEALVGLWGVEGEEEIEPVKTVRRIIDDSLGLASEWGAQSVRELLATSSALSDSPEETDQIPRRAVTWALRPWALPPIDRRFAWS